jgi:hypothetical protein
MSSAAVSIHGNHAEPPRPEALRGFVEEAVEAGGSSSVKEDTRGLVRRAQAENDLEARLLAALDTAGPASDVP